MSVKATDNAYMVFKALSNPIRLRILFMVSNTERPLHIKAVAKNLQVDYAAIYRHVEILKEAGLVQIFEVGRSRVISPLHTESLNNILSIADQMKRE